MKNYLQKRSLFDNSLSSLIDELFFDSHHDSFFKRYNDNYNYNIIRTGEDTYQIAINVAGFKKEDIEITQDDNMLIINAHRKDEIKEGNYLYQGFSSSFSRRFSIGKNSEILNASIEEGILIINIKEPELLEKQPKRIAIK